MGDKTPKMEEGEIPNRPHSRVAPLLTNTTPQERLAAVLRRLDTARTTYKLGAVELRLASTGLSIAPPGLATVTQGLPEAPPARPAAHPDTMLGYPGPSRLPQKRTGGDMGYGNAPGPGPGHNPSRAHQRSVGGESLSRGAAGPGPGPFPVVRAGGRGEGPGAGPVQQLSSECQRRRFNPEFKITMHNDRYKCEVLVQTIVIQGSKYYDTPQEAKAHTALKALKTVQTWPIPGPSMPPGQSGGRREPQRVAKADSQRVTNAEPETESPRASGPSSASGVDMTDPLQARAFVEGFRMGQMAAVPDRRSTEAQPDGKENLRASASLHSRSRSPRRRRRDSRHRSRSPRRHFDGSRHDPSLPSTDKYRPGGPAALRRDATQVAAEDNYGRLKEDDYY